MADSAAPPIDTRFAAALASDDSKSESEACRIIEGFPSLVNADSWLIHRGRYLTTACVIQVGRIPYHVTIAAGRIAAMERGPKLMTTWSFAIRATGRACMKHWERAPEAKWHDLFALTRYGEAVVEGYLLPLMQNLQVVKDMLAKPRNR